MFLTLKGGGLAARCRKERDDWQPKSGVHFSKDDEFSMFLSFEIWETEDGRAESVSSSFQSGHC
jgi:hypothetical protein